MITIRRARHAAVVLALLLALAASPASANPFLTSGGEEGRAKPAPRPPASSGPMVGAQIELRERAAEAIRSFGAEPSAKALAALLGAAFVYGLLHAAGPGHRKTVVFSLFLGRRAAPWEPLAAGFLAAGVHAGVGLVLVGALSLLRGAIASLGDAERVGTVLDGATFGILGLAAAALAAGKLRGLLSGKPRDGRALAGRGLYGVVAVTSLVPCPGATMILLFALYAGRIGLGVAGVAAMSLGMGVVISAAGYLAYTGREGLFRRLKTKERALWIATEYLELFSYLLVLGFAVYALWPFLAQIG
ncbi:MAG: hypothetical protein JNG85_13775 [Spirochaetaceae bacterium]|nr:hypothetical protein [Spirochaetaceae bacterium]